MSFPQCGQYNLNFPHCGKYNVNFPLRRKNGLKYSAKLEVKQIMFHNVHSKLNVKFDIQCGKYAKKTSIMFKSYDRLGMSTMVNIFGIGK